MNRDFLNQLQRKKEAAENNLVSAALASTDPRVRGLGDVIRALDSVAKAYVQSEERRDGDL